MTCVFVAFKQSMTYLSGTYLITRYYDQLELYLIRDNWPTVNKVWP